jgi:hypothetical protein
VSTQPGNGWNGPPGNGVPPGESPPQEAEPERISFKEAVKLAGRKPDSKVTRKDLLVRGGWLRPTWEWSRDANESLEDAVLNCKKLSQEFKFVGKAPKNPKDKRKKGNKSTTASPPSDDGDAPHRKSRWGLFK